MRNVVFCLVLPLMGFGLHPQDTADPLQQEVDISSAGLERRKALLRTERPGFPDWKELDVDATGAVSDVSPSALTEQTPEEMAAPILPGQVMTFESMPGLDPMQDAINSIMGDLMPYKEEVEKLNTTESKKSNKTKEEKLKKMKEEVKKDMVDLPKKVEASMNETKKRQEVLRLEAPCWKECQTCRFKETQAADECYATPEEAMVACSEAPCSGISTQRKECNGTWSIFIGSPEKVEMTVEELLTLKHRTWTLDRECLKMSSVNASKYIIFLTNASWTDAAKSCAEEKLEMATPYTKQDMKALTAAMQLAGAEKVHIGLHRDAQEGQGPWTNESAFYWINGEKLEKDWPGWGGYGLASLEENILDAGLPVRQPHLEAFLEGCVYVGYFQTLSEDGTRGAGDTTCDFFHIPFACQAIEERAVVVSVTTTTSTWPWRYGLAMEGSNACPSVKGVKAVPLERCQEAALEAVLPRGAKRSRSILQTGYDLGRDETQPWLTAPPGCSLNSGRDWAPIFNMGTGANNGDYTPLCMQPLPNAADLTNSMEVVETTFDSDRTGKYFHLYFPAEVVATQILLKFSPLHLCSHHIPSWRWEQRARLKQVPRPLPVVLPTGKPKQPEPCQQKALHNRSPNIAINFPCGRALCEFGETCWEFKGVANLMPWNNSGTREILSRLKSHVPLVFRWCPLTWMVQTRCISMQRTWKVVRRSAWNKGIAAVSSLLMRSQRVTSSPTTWRTSKVFLVDQINGSVAFVLNF